MIQKVTGDAKKIEKVTNGLSDVLDYDPDEDKWTKVGWLAKAILGHGMSLVPKETADYCV